MKRTFTLTIEKCPDEDQNEDRWMAVCPDLGIVVEAASAKEARDISLDLAPEMYALYVKDCAVREKRKHLINMPIRLKIIDKVALNLPRSMLAVS